MRPLYINSRSGFSVIKGDRYSIGGVKTIEESFGTTIIELSGAVSFYMFSDGFADQFGEDTGKKFMVRKLQVLLEEISSLPMAEQETGIRSAFSSWKGNAEQTDDVMIIGLRV